MEQISGVRIDGNGLKSNSGKERLKKNLRNHFTINENVLTFNPSNDFQTVEQIVLKELENTHSYQIRRENNLLVLETKEKPKENELKLKLRNRLKQQENVRNNSFGRKKNMMEEELGEKYQEALKATGFSDILDPSKIKRNPEKYKKELKKFMEMYSKIDNDNVKKNAYFDYINQLAKNYL